MLSDNTVEPWLLSDFSPSEPEVGSNSSVSVSSIDPKNRKHQVSLGPFPSTPGTPLGQKFIGVGNNLGVGNLVRVGDNLSFPSLLGRDILIITGPATLPEKFERNLGAIAMAYDSIRARLQNNGIKFSASLEISRDPDHLDSEALLVVIRVAQIPYKEILKIWDVQSKAFSHALDRSLSGKVHLIMRSGD